MPTWHHAAEDSGPRQTAEKTAGASQAWHSAQLIESTVFRQLYRREHKDEKLGEGCLISSAGGSGRMQGSTGSSLFGAPLSGPACHRVNTSRCSNVSPVCVATPTRPPSTRPAKLSKVCPVANLENRASPSEALSRSPPILCGRLSLDFAAAL